MKLRLNLGCGKDIRPGYTNVDFYETSGPIAVHDLSNIPWPWKDRSAEEILMLDFLEHFPYSMTDTILMETWRVLDIDGHVDIQVPDFEHCAMAALDMHQYLCNVCGNSGKDTKAELGDVKRCAQCGTPTYKIAEAAIMRLYGGQDSPGNFHYTAFTKDMLVRKLSDLGFSDMELLQQHHQFKNWNFLMRAYKREDVW